MRKSQHLALGFVIACLMGSAPLFAQTNNDIQTPVPINDMISSDSDAEIARLTDQLGRVTEENEQLREENERLRQAQDLLDLEEELMDDMDQESTDVILEDDQWQEDQEEWTDETMEEEGWLEDELSLESSEEHDMAHSRLPLELSQEEMDNVPALEDLTIYQNMISENILPYEIEQANELMNHLESIEAMLNEESDEEQLQAAWQEFVSLLLEYDDIIDMHLAVYETLMPPLEERANIYLLEAPLHEMRQELANARLSFSDAMLTQSVEHLQQAQELWRSVEHDEQLMNLLDSHLEVALTIEMLSRRYARGEDKLFHQPSVWNPRLAESSSVRPGDNNPEFASLQRAIMLWEQATLAVEQNNDYEDAMRLLHESQDHLSLYAGVSFERYRTVELNLSRRESLWRIAEEVYGDGFQWTRLWEANKDIIINPDRIYPGQQLGLPEAE